MRSFFLIVSVVACGLLSQTSHAQVNLNLPKGFVSNLRAEELHIFTAAMTKCPFSFYHDISPVRGLKTDFACDGYKPIGVKIMRGLLAENIEKLISGELDPQLAGHALSRAFYASRDACAQLGSEAMNCRMSAGVYIDQVSSMYSLKHFGYVRSDIYTYEPTPVVLLDGKGNSIQFSTQGSRVVSLDDPDGDQVRAQMRKAAAPQAPASAPEMPAKELKIMIPAPAPTLQIKPVPQG